MLNLHRIGRSMVWLALLAAVPAAAQVKEYREIQYPPLPEFKIAKPQTYKLKNGMTVFLLEDHELPLIEVIARVRTGSNYEPAGKAGLADMTGQVQREGGTKSMTGDQVDDFLAVRAAEIETGMGDDFGSASMSCLKQDFDDVSRVLYEILRYPAFAQDKLEVAKAQATAGIARRNDSIAQIAGREFQRLVYGAESPLSRMMEYATVAAISRDDLVGWHHKYYHPNNMLLGVVGDFDSVTMKKKIQQQFGDWPAGAAFREPEVGYAKDPGPGIYFIEKPDVTQAYVRLGHLGIKTSNPDYFAVQVMNEVLGGSFASRLFSNIRTTRGLAYSVSGGIGSSYTYPGVFQVGLSTKSSTMAEAVDALRTEVRSLIDKPPTDAELQRAKEAILNSFVFRYDSKEEVLAQQLTYAYYGMPEDFLERYRDSIEKVSREDVARVARQYVHPDKLKLLVVGRAAEFDKPVDSFGKVVLLDISIPPPMGSSSRLSRPEPGGAAGQSHPD